MTKIQSIQITARRWFQKSYGNTYHRVHVYIVTSDGKEHSYDSGIHYGYDEQYIQTAVDILKDKGHLTIDNKTPLWRWVEENGVEFTKSVLDVPRERDLKAFTL